jgi:hypothetical protein
VARTIGARSAPQAGSCINGRAFKSVVPLSGLKCTSCQNWPNCRFNSDADTSHRSGYALWAPVNLALYPSAFCLQRKWQSWRLKLFHLAGAKPFHCHGLRFTRRPCPLPSTARLLDSDFHTTTAFFRGLRAGLCLRSPAPSLVPRHRQAPHSFLASRSTVWLRSISLV